MLDNNEGEKPRVKKERKRSRYKKGEKIEKRVSKGKVSQGR